MVESAVVRFLSRLRNCQVIFLLYDLVVWDELLTNWLIVMHSVRLKKKRERLNLFFLSFPVSIRPPSSFLALWSCVSMFNECLILRTAKYAVLSLPFSIWQHSSFRKLWSCLSLFDSCITNWQIIINPVRLAKDSFQEQLNLPFYLSLSLYDDQEVFLKLWSTFWFMHDKLKNRNKLCMNHERQFPRTALSALLSFSVSIQVSSSFLKLWSCISILDARMTNWQIIINSIKTSER